MLPLITGRLRPVGYKFGYSDNPATAAFFKARDSSTLPQNTGETGENGEAGPAAAQIMNALDRLRRHLDRDHALAFMADHTGLPLADAERLFTIRGPQDLVCELGTLLALALDPASDAASRRVLRDGLLDEQADYFGPTPTGPQQADGRDVRDYLMRAQAAGFDEPTARRHLSAMVAYLALAFTLMAEVVTERGTADPAAFRLLG